MLRKTVKYFQNSRKMRLTWFNLLSCLRNKIIESKPDFDLPRLIFPSAQKLNGNGERKTQIWRSKRRNLPKITSAHGGVMSLLHWPVYNESSLLFCPNPASAEILSFRLASFVSRWSQQASYILVINIWYFYLLNKRCDSHGYSKTFSLYSHHFLKFVGRGLRASDESTRLVLRNRSCPFSSGVDSNFTLARGLMESQP